MADEPKRIIDLTEVSSVAAGDYIAMDSEDGGTKKIPASHFTGGSGQVMWGGIQGDITQQEDLNGYLDQLPNKADIDGYYEDMSVGSAEQLLSNTYTPDSTPYLYRTSGGSIEIGNRVYEDAIVGGSVAWNQLVQNGNFADTTGWNFPSSTGSVNNNEVTVTVTDQTYNQGVVSKESNSTAWQVNHKILVMFDVKSSVAGKRMVPTLARTTSLKNPLGAFDTTTAWSRYEKIINIAEVTDGVRICSLSPSTFEVGDILYFRNIHAHDLTLALGSTIADYAYTLEQATAGSGIAWLKSQGFFNKEYYPYNAGGIQSVKTSAKKVVGFNQWDEQWELGQYNASTGEKSAITDRIRSKNAIAVLPNTQYYFRLTTIKYVYYYDINNNYIGSYIMNATHGYNYFTTPSNCWFVRFNLTNTYGTTYNNNICINLHWDGERDGEYEAYEEHTYPLGNDELRGLFKLSNGKIYADGDVKTSDGQIARRYGIVDLGTLTWQANTTGTADKYRMKASISGLKMASSTTAKANLVCAKYVSVSGIDTYSLVVGICASHTEAAIFVYDSNYDTITSASAFKTAMSGIYLVYELTTPTTETADPYTNPQWVDNWGTEQFVDERDVPVPVGHDSRYLPDLKAKVESAPNNPSTDGKYFLQYENGQATYVPVPSEVPEAPSEDGTYVLKATVSGGTATLAWVAEE